MVNLLTEQTFWFEDWDSTATSRPTNNAGRLGIWSVMVSLANITSIDDIVGLSAGSSCTQSSPMWMHFSTSVATLDFKGIWAASYPEIQPQFSFFLFFLFVGSLPRNYAWRKGIRNKMKEDEVIWLEKIKRRSKGLYY